MLLLTLVGVTVGVRDTFSHSPRRLAAAPDEFKNGGEGGIRTHDRVAPIRHFQSQAAPLRTPF